MKIKKTRMLLLMVILLVSAGLLSASSANYKGTGFTHNIPDNYYDSYSIQDILNKYNDTYFIAEEKAVCTNVVDGDTIYLSNGKKVRFVGVNTPEKGVTGYHASKEFVKKLCLNREVGINIDDRKYTDKYGRTLAVVLVDGKNLNEMLLKEGLAEVMYIPPSEFSPYTWAGNNMKTTNNYATDNTQLASNSNDDAKSSSDSGSYIGNSNSHKFHKPDCEGVTKMSEKNKVYFNNRQEAIDMGYVSCKICNP